MDFANESYTRQYTRKTATNRMLGWDGRAVLWAMNAGEFDRSGYFDFCGSPAESISAVTDIPLEIVEVALAKLLRTKTWILEDGRIYWPNYEEAQTCRKSDRLRQKESREGRAPSSPSHPVTRRHTATETVTPSSAQPSLTKPGSAEPSVPPTPQGAGAGAGTRKPGWWSFPEGWSWSAETASEARMQGVTDPQLQEHVDYWTTHDFARPVTNLDKELVRQIPHIKTRSAKPLARAGPKGSAREETMQFLADEHRAALAREAAEAT